MYLKEVIIFILQLKLAFLYVHNKPVANSIWPERCFQNEKILNDCNYCTCNKFQQFICTARVCNEVDMFGHFKDTIADINVGMEGHGSWRSVQQACTPKMLYRRQGLVCVCDENGYWPSPVCRDVFRIFHDIELTTYSKPMSRFKCTHNKLYLFGCNVCICDSNGRINPQLCTKNTCNSTDPVLYQDVTPEDNRIDIDDNLIEVYAPCDFSIEYFVGCKLCKCLRNNRLLCEDKCYNGTATVQSNKPNLCSNRTRNKTFNMDCNVCTCDKKGMLFCTTKRCLKEYNKPPVELSKSIDLNLRLVTPPLNGNECVPGTRYKDDCNTCYCSGSEKGKKFLSCTKMFCRKKPRLLHKLRTDCVENTVYELNCMICRCDAVDGVKRESCEVKPSCDDQNAKLTSAVRDLSDLRGYCEPFHTYKKGCNSCKCMEDGKIVECTADVCEDENPITIDIIPVSQKGGLECRKNGMYQVACNFCFCLSDGNILCTTSRCDN